MASAVRRPAPSRQRDHPPFSSAAKARAAAAAIAAAAWHGEGEEDDDDGGEGGDFFPEDESDMGTAEEERARMLEDVLRDEAMLFDKMAWKLFEGRIASLKEDSTAAEEAKATTVEDSGQEKVGKEEEDLQVTSGEKTVLARNEKSKIKEGRCQRVRTTSWTTYFFLLLTLRVGSYCRVYSKFYFFK